MTTADWAYLVPLVGTLLIACTTYLRLRIHEARGHTARPPTAPGPGADGQSTTRRYR